MAWRDKVPDHEMYVYQTMWREDLPDGGSTQHNLRSALTAPVMTFICSVLPLPELPSTYISSCKWLPSLDDSFIRREQGQMIIHKSLTVLSVPSEHLSIHFCQAQVVQSHSWIFLGSPVNVTDPGDTCPKPCQPGCLEVQDLSVALQEIQCWCSINHQCH